MATKKIDLSLSTPTLSPKAKIALAVILGVLVLFATYSIAHSAGFEKGHAAGLAEGNAAGDKSGFERGYWKGAEYGCNYVFDSVKAPYVVGEQNPFSSWYAFMGIGNVYLDRTNCKADNHGAAPYSGGPTDSN